MLPAMLRASQSARWAHWYPDPGILALAAAALIAGSFAVGMWLGFEASTPGHPCISTATTFNDLNSAAEKARTAGDQAKFEFLMGEVSQAVHDNPDCFDTATVSSWGSLSAKYNGQ